MKKYVAAALAIGITIGPASAVDVDVGGTVGGVGVSAGLSAGSQGVSADVGTSVDAVGGANVGASTTGGGSLGVSAGGNLGGTSAGVSTGADGVGGANVGASTSGSGSLGVSAGGSLGGIGAGVSTGAQVGDHPSVQGGPPASGRRPAAVTKALAKAAAHSIILPRALRPSRAADGDLRRLIGRHPFAVLPPLKAVPGTSGAVVRACRAAIMTAAKPLGAVRVYAASAGPARQLQSGLNAPIAVRIDYERQGGIEVRQARVGCRLNAAGMVTAVI